MALIQQQIRDLERQITLLKLKQKDCIHEWTAPYYNPESIRVQHIVPGQYEGRGSSIWPVTRWETTQKARWTRHCVHCGFEQHTYKQAPIISGQAPDFG